MLSVAQMGKGRFRYGYLIARLKENILQIRRLLWKSAKLPE
jgi:hypothetical protein